MSFKLQFMQIRCNFPDISYLSETQKNNFQFLSKRFFLYLGELKSIISSHCVAREPGCGRT